MYLRGYAVMTCTEMQRGRGVNMVGCKRTFNGEVLKLVIFLKRCGRFVLLCVVFVCGCSGLGLVVHGGLAGLGGAGHGVFCSVVVEVA